MKLLYLFFILMLLIPALSSAEQINERDVGAHVAVSAVFGAISESVLHYNKEYDNAKLIVYATVLGSIPGLAKEIADSMEDNNYFSGVDMASNVVGAFAGAVISNFINNRMKVKIEKEGKNTRVLLSHKF